METDQDMSTLQNIPGYKLILKSVLKSQIQLLVQQLSDFGEEECCILTASLKDGSLSHLGSHSGKDFLESRMELKSQFLAHCLSNQHTQKTNNIIPGTSGLPVNIAKNSPKSAKKSFTGQRPAPYRLILPAPKTDQGHGQDPSGTEVNQANIENDPKTSPEAIQIGNEKTENQSESVQKETGSSENNVTNQSRFQQKEITDNQSTVGEYANEHSETESGTIIVKQEPDDMDLYMSGSGTSASNRQDDSGNQLDQSQKTDRSGLGEVLPSAKQQDHAQPSSVSCTCKVCGKYLTNANYLKYHMVVHSDERPFVCDICGLTFKLKHALKEHKLRHDPKLSRFTCQYCGKQFFAHKELKHHLAKHTGDKKFECKVCHKKFGWLTALSRHRQKHVVTKRYFCNHCEKSFARQDYIRKHILQKHPHLKNNKTADLYDTIISRENSTDLTASKDKAKSESESHPTVIDKENREEATINAENTDLSEQNETVIGIDDVAVNEEDATVNHSDNFIIKVKTQTDNEPEEIIIILQNETDSSASGKGEVQTE